MLVLMINVNDFCSKYWRAIAWTAFYVLVMWAILHYLFNFDIFSLAHWVKLQTVELHGFPGLVFGVLILAAVPLYVATTVVTVRNKSVPIRIPLPRCFDAPPKPAEPAPPAPVVTEQEVLPELHPGVPAEMRESFMRARRNYGSRQMSVFNKPASINAVGVPVGSVAPSAPVQNNTHAAAPIDSDVTTETAFPIPADFDIESTDDKDYGVPVFSEINFDDDNDNADSDASAPGDDLCEFLNGAGHNANRTDNDLIMVDNFVIAVHDDDDFWVADDSDWFAAGRQKPSPIAALNDACAANKDLHPVMYLGNQNIMDGPDHIEKWRAAGIDVITDRDELLELIKNS